MSSFVLLIFYIFRKKMWLFFLKFYTSTFIPYMIKSCFIIRDVCCIYELPNSNMCATCLLLCCPWHHQHTNKSRCSIPLYSFLFLWTDDEMSRLKNHNCSLTSTVAGWFIKCQFSKPSGVRCDCSASSAKKVKETPSGPAVIRLLFISAYWLPHFNTL